MNTNHDYLWARILADATTDIAGVHGLRHWGSVQVNGRTISSALPGAIPSVINLFAFFHDSQRLHDGRDDGHGERAAAFARSLRAEGLFKLPDKEFELLYYACAHHTDGELSSDPTIGVCWDADRLDLGRVGIKAEARYLSTDFGRKAAAAKSKTFLSIDTQGGLESGIPVVDSETRLPATGLSASGLSALISKLMRNYKDPQQAKIEIAVEVVRRESFPQYPPKQSVLHACDSWENLKRVAKYMIRPEGMFGPVFEVTGQSFGPFDGLIPYTAVRTTDPLKRAWCYWSGLKTNEPALEYLIAAPITIGRKVGYISRDGSAVIY